MVKGLFLISTVSVNTQLRINHFSLLPQQAQYATLFIAVVPLAVYTLSVLSLLFKALISISVFLFPRSSDPGRMDLGSALSGRREGVPTVVMAHQPWAAVEALMWSDVRLVLSGHTHAGQIFPMAPFVYLYNPFFVGLYQPSPDVYVYVSPGTLYYLVPFRHYRSEITYFTLLSS